MNGEMACLKSLFSGAIQAGLCDANPVARLRLVNPNNVRDRLLSPEETARLFYAAEQQSDFVRPLFHVLYHTGMRLGEALALEWTDVELDNQRLVIRRSKTGEGRRSTPAEGARRPINFMEANGKGQPVGLPCPLRLSRGRCRASAKVG